MDTTVINDMICTTRFREKASDRVFARMNLKGFRPRPSHFQQGGASITSRAPSLVGH